VRREPARPPGNPAAYVFVLDGRREDGQWAETEPADLVAVVDLRDAVVRLMLQLSPRQGR
jgi:hypothetical protein